MRASNNVHILIHGSTNNLIIEEHDNSTNHAEFLCSKKMKKTSSPLKHRMKSKQDEESKKTLTIQY